MTYVYFSSRRRHTRCALVTGVQTWLFRSAVEAGAQGALLAPTEILARQHLQSLTNLTDGLPIRIAILTGREKGRARDAVLQGQIGRASCRERGGQYG